MTNETKTTTDSTLATLSDLQVAEDQAGTRALSLAKDNLPADQYEAEVDKAMAELASLDTNSIIHYGSQAQEQVTAIADQMLDGVKSKDAGPAGNMLAEMVVVLRGFDMDKLDPNKKQSLWDKLLRRAKPIAKFAEQSNEMLDAQKLKDLRATRDDLERRVHDLRLTRQVAMQSLPSIRMVQNNDKGLVSKINSTLINTIPLWRQQLAQAITIFRSNKAADTLKAATDLTNDLLEANAENLNQANAQARRQIERGVFDIESVKKANDTLIKTIEESLQISAEGKKARAQALTTLEQTEHELKDALRKAAAKEQTINAK